MESGGQPETVEAGVLFVSVSRGILKHLPDDQKAVLCAPARGLAGAAVRGGLVNEHIEMPIDAAAGPRSGRLACWRGRPQPGRAS